MPGPGKPVAGKVAGWFLKHSDLSICLLLAAVAALICLPTLVHVFPTIAMSCWLALALSGMSMYALSRSLLSRSQSLIGAAFYITVHYHLFDLYQRCAINEFWAFVWIPLVLHATYLVASGRSRYGAVYLAVSYGLLLLTHLPSTLVVSSVLPIVVLIQTREIKRLIVAGASAVLGAGMAGIYVGSVLFETGYLAEIRRYSRPRYRDAFLLEHLSAAIQTVPLPSSGSFLLFVLFGDWLASGFLNLFVISTLVIWKAKNSPFRQSRLLLAIWAAAVVSLLMTTRISLPLWLVIPRLRVIQFPIRWFAITSAGASMLVAVSCAVLGSMKRSLPGFVALAIAMTLNLAISALVLSQGALSTRGVAGAAC